MKSLVLLETNKTVEYRPELKYIAPEKGWVNASTGTVCFYLRLLFGKQQPVMSSIYDLHFNVCPTAVWSLYKDGQWRIL